ncbi:MAG: biotin--[acetyl-CoA-carboxylase] ligase [Thermodesulfobacteriota bacterium]
MSELRVRILGRDPSGEADSLTPEALAACHPLWADFVGSPRDWRESPGPGGQAFFVPRKAGGESVPGDRPARLTVCGPCSSGFDVAWAMVRAGDFFPFDSVLVVSQRGGRGQMRREWDSPPGNVYGVVSCPGDLPGPESLLPVFFGYVMASRLFSMGVEAFFKWPNDVVVRGKKVGGVLLEERAGRVLAGVGVNLTSAPTSEKLRREHALPAGTLAEIGLFPGPVRFWADLVKFLQTCYHDCVTATCSFPPVTRMEQRLAFLGRNVLVREGGKDVYAARVLGLAEDGGLRLMRREDGRNRECVIHSGGITLL